MNNYRLEWCEHIKNAPFDVIIQSIGWETDGAQYSVCEKCYSALLIKQKEEQKEKYK